RGNHGQRGEPDQNPHRRHLAIANQNEDHGSGQMGPDRTRRLAYHTAVFMGTDVDQPRNLAKSVTVE
ncbi:MAG TPA: hypothetical protein VL133_01195, partial [Devosia sp.]|nr:hypothetical protein [Devosia sp.]